MNRYDRLAERSLRGETLSRAEARAVLQAPDTEVPLVLHAAWTVRAHFFGRRVKLCVLQNARSGLCPEDCHYCSQSRLSTADIEKYGLRSVPELVEGAAHARAAGATRYCLVTSGRGPSQRDVDVVCAAARAIRAAIPVELCACLGLLTAGQAQQLRGAGVGWVNHNLNTSARFYPEICTTHTYEDRVATVREVRAAGLGTCSGGIVGMGETDDDIVELLLALRALQVESIPINFLHPIAGTPLAQARHLTPVACLKVLCLARFLNPASEIRAAGGREVNLRSLQALALYPANSIFVQGYLTTPGQAVAEARQMIGDLGFEVEGAAADAGAGLGATPPAGAASVSPVPV